jgi:hypothetical protein
MEWSRALDLAAGRMFPAVALRQLIESRHRTGGPELPALTVPARGSGRRAPLALPVPVPGAGAGRGAVR